MAGLDCRPMKPASTRRPWAFVLCAGLLSTEAAWAATPAEKATAEALFDEGVAALKAGNPALACQKLDQSQRIEPGVGVLLYLGDCYEKLGRTASAWAIFREAASIADARGDDRAPVAKERAERLTPRLSKLTIIMEVGADTSVPGLEITRDGTPVPQGLWGSPVPVDPGTHTIAATAPGYTREEVTIQVEGEAVVATVSIPHISKLPPSATPAGPGKDGPASAPLSSPLRPLGIATAIVGVAGLGVGATFGALAISKKDELSKLGCDATTCPTNQGASTSREGMTFATVSDIGFIAGGALLVTGVTLFLAAPKARETARVTPVLAPGLAGFHLEGSF
jgi:hypothetical protein